MSRRGRYRKFRPEFEPEPWHTDGSENDSESFNNLNESITENNPSEEGPIGGDTDETQDHGLNQAEVLLEALGHRHVEPPDPEEARILLEALRNNLEKNGMKISL